MNGEDFNVTLFFEKMESFLKALEAAKEVGNKFFVFCDNNREALNELKKNSKEFSQKEDNLEMQIATALATMIEDN